MIRTIFIFLWLFNYNIVAANPIPNIDEPSPQELPKSALHLSTETLEHMDRERF